MSRVLFVKFAVMTIFVMVVISVGCKGKEVVPPVSMGESTIVGQAALSIVGFTVEQPDFVDARNRAMRVPGSEKVAVVRVQVENVSDGEIVYYPQHSASPSLGVQLSTLPDKESGERLPIGRVSLPTGVLSVSQEREEVKLGPGAKVVDSYLFSVPRVSDSELLLLIPGSVVGQPSVVSKFVVNNPPEEVGGKSAAKLGEAVVIDGVSMKVVGVKNEYVEAEGSAKDWKPLKYPYAYSQESLLRVEVEIKNGSKSSLTYDPGHRVNESYGVILESKDGRILGRVKLPSSAIAKGQVKSALEIKPGESVKDVYLFAEPIGSTELSLFISGHLFGVKGLFSYKLKYEKGSVSAPNLEPYKSGEVAAAAE